MIFIHCVIIIIDYIIIMYTDAVCMKYGWLFSKFYVVVVVVVVVVSHRFIA